MTPARRKLADNLKRVQQRIADACSRASRDPATVRLVAVTKNAPIDIIRSLVDSGVTDLGENRVQELARRAAMIQEWLVRRGRDTEAGEGPRWHMIGHLQRNKVKALLPWTHTIHSLDSLRLAEEIDAHAARLGRVVQVLLEVNASGEASKTGVAVAAAAHLAEQVRTLKHVQLRGLMTMAPLTDDESVVRHVFERTRELFDEMIGERVVSSREFTELSMGMSQDFEWAIEYGATWVRVGGALFDGIDLGAPPADVETTASA